MSSDEESVNNDPVVSDNEQNNEILEIGEDLQVPEEHAEEVQRDETAEAENEDGEKKIVKPKRVIRNPQPKLNEETLKGPRGIAALESYFQRVKFKGKGKEQEDLEVIMKTYEYWCHRLFPKFPFDTCIERLEKLGSKRAVQTHIKRIRFDLLFEDKPILDDSDEEPNVEGFVDIQNDEINQQQNQQFDQLLSSSASVTTTVDLTGEQLERIRLNKERAEKLRQERLKKIRDKAEESLHISSQLPGTSGLRNETRLESSEATQRTQSDIFSQEDSPWESEKNTRYILDEKNSTETIFDHESKLKGKSNVKGVSIKHISKKRTAVFSSDSENSDDDIADKVQNKQPAFSNKVIPNHIELSNINQNSSDSDSGFAVKKKSKRNIIYDSDDNQSIDEGYKKDDDSRYQNPDNANDNVNDENSAANNISNKKLIDTDEMEDADECSKELNMTKKSKEKITDLVNDHDVDLNSPGCKPINLSNILNVEKTSNITMDKLETLGKLTEMKKHLNNDEPMEIIDNELEAVLKSSRDRNFGKNLENKENSSEDNII